MTLHNVNNYLF